MVRDNFVRDMHMSLLQWFCLLHVISAATTTLTFQPYDRSNHKGVLSQLLFDQSEPKHWDMPVENPQPTKFLHRRKQSNNQQKLNPQAKNDQSDNPKILKPYIYFRNQYLSYKLNQDLESKPSKSPALMYKDRLSPIIPKEDLVLFVTQSYAAATNKARLPPRPVLYKLGFVTQPPAFKADAALRQELFNAGSSDSVNSDSEDKTTFSMEHIILIVTVSFIASLVAIGLATVVFLMNRRKNSPKEIAMAGENWNKTSIDMVSKEVGLRRSGMSSYELNMALSAVPPCPLTECPPTAPGLGQAILQRCQSTYSSNLIQNSKFINQFSDFVGSNGGCISSPQSNVSLVVPAMAVPQGDLQQVFVNVSLDGDNFQVCKDQSEVQLSPVVEVATPNRSEWENKVELILPHRALLENSDWKIQVKFQKVTSAGSDVNSLQKWALLEPSLFNCDGQTVRISTQDSGIFVVVGREEKQGGDLPLSACVEAWVNRSETQTNYRVYVAHDILDVHKRICEMEQVYGGSPLSAAVPLTLHTHSADLQVRLDVCSADRLPPTVKSISSELCYACYETPCSVELHQVNSVSTTSTHTLSLLGPQGKLTRLPQYMYNSC